jgi:prevent-host-death family protein
MPKIVPISDLRNNISEISSICHQDAEPVYVTKNGKGDLVVTSMRYFERMQAQLDLYDKLAVAEAELVNGVATIPHDEVMKEIRSKLNGK